MGRSKNNWDDLLTLLDQRRPIPVRQKSGGAIEYWREWDASRNRAVWGKRYQFFGARDLRTFNSAEIEWLMRLADTKVSNTYRRVKIEQEGTSLAEPSQTVIRTLDCGPTLDDWLRTPVRHGGRTQAHCLVQAETFLRMAQAVMQALDGVHACHFVHCDLHPGNITLPVGLQQAGADAWHITPRWDEVTLIDFGYSIDAMRPPKTILPLVHTGEGVRISPQLRAVLQQVEHEAQQRLAPGERWEDVWLNAAWWQRLRPSPLEAFKQVDWREDCYQLGRLLADIRDNAGATANEQGRVIRPSSSASVNQCVDELPERLIQWGQAPCSEAEASRPLQNLIEWVQRTLNTARSEGHSCPTAFELNRVDFEPAHSATACAEADLVRRQADAFKPAEPTELSRPDWAKYVADLPLPAMQPLRVAAPVGWQFMVASTPVTWRQWRAACQHNAQLVRPGLLAYTLDVPPHLLDAPVTHVSHQDCLAYIDTINHLCGAHAVGDLALFRLPAAAEWALLSAGDASKPGSQWVDACPASTPVTQWAANSHGLAGVHHHLWQWLAATPGAAWAQVRGGCTAQPLADDGLDAIDHYPCDYRSPFITLRLVRHVPVQSKAV